MNQNILRMPVYRFLSNIMYTSSSSTRPTPSTKVPSLEWCLFKFHYLFPSSQLSAICLTLKFNANVASLNKMWRKMKKGKEGKCIRGKSCLKTLFSICERLRKLEASSCRNQAPCLRSRTAPRVELFNI
jgi:hypothetical protein